MKNVTEFIANNWPWISPILYELILRLVPSNRNLSIIDMVFKIISKLVPNYSTTNTTVQKEGETPKTVITHVVKVVVSIAGVNRTDLKLPFV